MWNFIHQTILLVKPDKNFKAIYYERKTYTDKIQTSKCTKKCWIGKWHLSYGGRVEVRTCSLSSKE